MLSSLPVRRRDWENANGDVVIQSDSVKKMVRASRGAFLCSFCRVGGDKWGA